MFPFEVICIKSGQWVDIATGETHPGPGSGERCTVVGEEGGWYIINGYMNVPGLPGMSTWEPKDFIRVGGKDEVQIAEERIAADAAELDADWGRLLTDLENEQQ